MHDARFTPPAHRCRCGRDCRRSRRRPPNRNSRARGTRCPGTSWRAHRPSHYQPAQERWTALRGLNSNAALCRIDRPPGTAPPQKARARPLTKAGHEERTLRAYSKNKIPQRPTDEALARAFAAFLDALTPIVAERLQAGMADRPYTTLEPPPGLPPRSAKFLRIARLLRANGDEGSWKEGRISLVTREAWERGLALLGQARRQAPRAPAVTSSAHAAPSSTPDELALSLLGLRRRAS